MIYFFLQESKLLEGGGRGGGGVSPLFSKQKKPLNNEVLGACEGADNNLRRVPETIDTAGHGHFQTELKHERRLFQFDNLHADWILCRDITHLPTRRWLEATCQTGCSVSGHVTMEGQTKASRFASHCRHLVLSMSLKRSKLHN